MNRNTDKAKMLIFPLRIKSIYTPSIQRNTRKTKDTARAVRSALSYSQTESKKASRAFPPSRPFIGIRFIRA